MENPKTVIISGANGYFGSIACKYFAKSGWNVLKAMRQAGADIELDLDKPEELAKQQCRSQVDLFIHAAAAHEVSCRESPYRSIYQNVVGTRAALDFCVNNQINSFIYISTVHVFGRPCGRIDELSQPLPINDYGLSHLQAEQYTQMYTLEGKIKGMVIRPSNFFGIPEDLKNFKRWTLTPFAFCREALENGKIILKTPGFQERNFISVLDICRAIQAGYPYISQFPLLHLAGPDTLRIRDLAYLVQETIYRVYKTKVDLFIPEGIFSHDDFIFASCHLETLYKPNEKITDFIEKFCRKLEKELSLVS